MTYARIQSGIVVELIPEFDPVFPGVPITDRFASNITSACVLFDSELQNVKEGYTYSELSKEFSEPIIGIEPLPDVPQ